MKLGHSSKKEWVTKAVWVALLLVVALLSIFVISKIATNPQTYTATIESIDEKKATVMTLTATAATASSILAAVPGDVTTPIANQIMEMSGYLMIVVCILVLEKSLLTVMGYLSFNILIPIACGLLGVYIFIKREQLLRLALKIIVFALVITLIIPLGLKLSDLVYEVNQDTVQQLTSTIKDESTTEATESTDITAEEQEEQSWWNQAWNTITNTVTNAVDNVTNTVDTIKEDAKATLNAFIDAIALFIIAYCAIPIIVVLVVIGFVKFLFGISIPIPKTNPFSSHRKNKKEEQTKELVEV